MNTKFLLDIIEGYYIIFKLLRKFKFCVSSLVQRVPWPPTQRITPLIRNISLATATDDKIRFFQRFDFWPRLTFNAINLYYQHTNWTIFVSSNTLSSISIFAAIYLNISVKQGRQPDPVPQIMLVSSLNVCHQCYLVYDISKVHT